MPVPSPMTANFICIKGEGTGKALEERGIQYDYMPTKYSIDDLSKEWVSTLTRTDKILLLRAKEASKQLTWALEKADMEYEEIGLYETIIDSRKQEELNRIIHDMDYITFASASAVKAFASMITNPENINGKIICIGPVTEASAIEKGIQVYKTASTYTAEGIRDVLLRDVM